jgi:hypothetical protein
MQNKHNLPFMSARPPYRMLSGCISGLVLVLFMFSCSSIPILQQAPPLEEEYALPLRYSMVFIIHGDGNYVYHDTQGNEQSADEKALVEATLVAMLNPQAEVFIFHEKPRRHMLLFFPLRDGAFYYYRYGHLLAKKLYWRDQGLSRFDAEVELYHQFRAEKQSKTVRLLLYFGHEIPEFEGAGYDASYSDWTFTVHDLAQELKRIKPDSTKFDLMVLSTCFNGTPHTIARLAPLARTIVASPENLHLSYFDLHQFIRLDVGLGDGDIAEFAKKFANQAFDQLSEDIQTAISVAVYDIDRVQNYLQAVDSAYDHNLAKLKGFPAGSIEHCDCAEDSTYVLPGMSDGVDLFYRPARFGRLKNKQDHSGWECWRLVN